MILPRLASPFDWIQTPTACGIICRPLDRMAPHVFTTRAWRLGLAANQSPEAWREVADAMQVSPDRLVRLRQVHGADVLVHRATEAFSIGVAADIVVTDNRSSAITIQTADCVPLLLCDVRLGAVAAAHAGWRGTALRVAARAVEAMSGAFGSRPSDLMAAIGPCIGPCCYQVGDEVRDRFVEEGTSEAEIARWFAPRPTEPSAHAPRPRGGHRPPSGRLFLDLEAATRDQLEACGVRRDRIFAAALCTASQPDLLCSYRRDGSTEGRMAAAIRPATSA
jgi:YfiH family protein